jgi:hypothetical protein
MSALCRHGRELADVMSFALCADMPAPSMKQRAASVASMRARAAAGSIARPMRMS